ncbi:MAG: hypothetical protein WBG42_15120 [Cryomorphaceae bacterium]
MRSSNRHPELKQVQKTLSLGGERIEMRKLTIGGRDRVYATQTFQVVIEMIETKAFHKNLIAEAAGTYIDSTFSEWLEDFLQDGDFDSLMGILKTVAGRKKDIAYIGIITELNFTRPEQREFELGRILRYMPQALEKYQALIFVKQDEFSPVELDDYDYMFKMIENSRFMMRCRGGGLGMMILQEP